MAAQKDEAFVEYVAKQLVEKPDAVKVNRTIDEMGVLVELTVDKDDMGVIIGKEGRTAKAIRTLLRVLGAQNDARVNLKIVEPEGAEHSSKKETKEKEKEVEKKEDKKEEVKEKEAEEQVQEDDFVDLDEEK